MEWIHEEEMRFKMNELLTRLQIDCENPLSQFSDSVSDVDERRTFPFYPFEAVDLLCRIILKYEREFRRVLILSK